MTDLANPYPDREHVALRFEGGPMDGETRQMYLVWPPSEAIPGPKGEYRRKAMSALERPVKGIIRGALYEWVDAMAEGEASSATAE